MFKVLIPTDFSETADNAFRYALNFAERAGAQLIVLHVYEPPQIRTMTLPYTMEEVYQSMEVEAFENFEDNIPHLKEIAEKEGKEMIPMKHLVLKGDVKKMIKATVRNEEINLIIMGTQGAGIVKQFFFGNQTAHMMEHSEVPVLAIPPNISPYKRLSNLALATDYETRAYKAMDWLINWTEELEVNLFSLHICPSESKVKADKRRKWNEKYEQLGVACHENIATNFLVGLDSFKQKQNINIIAMVTRSRNFIYDLFNKNLAKEVVYAKNTALLAIPEAMLNKISE